MFVMVLKCHMAQASYLLDEKKRFPLLKSCIFLCWPAGVSSALFLTSSSSCHSLVEKWRTPLHRPHVLKEILI